MGKNLEKITLVMSGNKLYKVKEFKTVTPETISKYLKKYDVRLLKEKEY